ncbi:MAG: ribonuclease III family protein [Bacteroidetes bacterium]|nr:ribonuclease III family protein [Bacteroidota bacterium]
MPLRKLISRGDSRFSEKIYRLTGIRPRRLGMYREALRHSSVNETDSDKKKLQTDNERLEFLGDAILDAVVAELLFMRYPYKQEGFLTEMRMRVVNREQLAYLASRLGLTQLMEIKPDLLRNHTALKSIGGNALEALIGAIYLDKGYRTTRKFISQRLIGQYLDLEKLMSTTISYKAQLLKWSQQNKKKVEWKHQVTNSGGKDLHEVILIIEGEELVQEHNHSRKKAEELCCEKACRQLQIDDNTA